MLLELLLKRDDNTLIAKISAYSLESLEEQMHKIEKVIKNEKEKEKETAEENKRDRFVETHQEELEKVFHLDNPEITKDDFGEKFEEFISTSTLKDLSNLIK